MKRPFTVITAIVAMAIAMSLGASAQSVVFPQKQQPGAARSARHGSSYTLSNKVLSATFELRNGTLRFGGSKALHLEAGTELFSITLADGCTVAASQMQLSGLRLIELRGDHAAATASCRDAGKAVEAQFDYGDIRIEWRALLRDGSHYLRTELSVSTASEVQISEILAMDYRTCGDSLAVVGNTRGAVLASKHIFAGLETPMGLNSVTPSGELRGLWRRSASLLPGSMWQVSAVVGLIAPGQARRSFLAYSERERAVPWRPFPVYVSWYELNIDRNNALAPHYEGNMTAEQCADVVRHWKRSFFDVHGIAPEAFVWDDGWDEYGTWTFNCNFPDGFDVPAAVAASMGTGIGAWLGPVGGYGESGKYRRDYWKERGGMQLSNDEYYRYFIASCGSMIDRYDFRFFKFDGISAQFSAVGPDDSPAGEENVEAIISIERAVRQKRPDIFINTTVGTWASPFWFHFTDAVWRQEADYAEAGDQGTDRERWITYRDRLVYQNFVQQSPLCPINTLMTHGFILSRHGAVSRDMDYEAVRREMRCAFACGSGMVELYCDYELMDSIGGGALWNDLAECMKWQRRQADVLPDTHWVGGNPWDGQKAGVYGWAAWNGSKAVLSLRNPAATQQELRLTLREALDIPAYLRGSVSLANAFAQPALAGIDCHKPIDIDTPITVVLPASSLFVFDGTMRRR